MAINPWENPQLVSYNTLSPRAPLYSFDTLNEVLTEKNSSYKKSLNGQWEFKLFENPLSAYLDVKNWDEIEVPSCWTRQGFKDLPIYTNVQMPFDESYPNLSKKYNIPLIPFLLEGVALNPEFNQSDGMHPNEKGALKISKTLEKNIKENYLKP